MATGKKTGGRKAGTPNKLTKELRATLKSIMHEEVQRLPELLKELDTEKRVEAIIKLMPFVYPKVDAIDAKAGEPVDFDMDTY